MSRTFEIVKHSFSDWRGHVCSTIFLYGCNMRCIYCHNTSLATNNITPDYDSIVEEVRNNLNTDKIRCVCFTGGEPTVHGEEIIHMFERIRELGIFIKLDTNGLNNSVLRSIIESQTVSYISMDIKAPLSKNRYEEITRVDVNIGRIIDSIKSITNSGIAYEFRSTVFPSYFNKHVIETMVYDLAQYTKTPLSLQPARFMSNAYSNRNTLVDMSNEREYNLIELKEIERELHDSFHTKKLCDMRNS